MHVGVPSVIALLWVIFVSGCAGNEITPAKSAAPAPGSRNPITALYAAPADSAFVTVSDVSTDIVGPDDVSFPVTFLGSGYAVEVLAPVPAVNDGSVLPIAHAGPESVAPPAHDAGPDILSPPLDAK